MEIVSSTFGYPAISSRSTLPARQEAFGPGDGLKRPPDDPAFTAARQQGVQISAPTAEFTPYSSANADGEKKISQVDGKDSAKDIGSGRGVGKSADKTDGTSEDPQIQAEIARLKSIELKVKAHEAAHKAAGGALAGPVSYTYQRGPDGRNYVVGGEVPIEISTGSTPQETISRMQQVISAALAPADPSPQDRAVAAQASNIQQQARQQAASANASVMEKSSSEAEKPDKSLPGAAAVSGQNRPEKSYDASSASEVFRPVSIYA